MTVPCHNGKLSFRVLGRHFDGIDNVVARLPVVKATDWKSALRPAPADLIETTTRIPIDAYFIDAVIRIATGGSIYRRASARRSRDFSPLTKGAGVGW